MRSEVEASQALKAAMKPAAATWDHRVPLESYERMKRIVMPSIEFVTHDHFESDNDGADCARCDVSTGTALHPANELGTHPVQRPESGTEARGLLRYFKFIMAWGLVRSCQARWR
jgi:hypothetical protein